MDQSNVAKKGHEAEVHVQLLMAMEKGQTRIVRDERYLRFLIAAQHQDILDDSCGWETSDAVQLKTVPVKMNRMDVVAGIAHANSITLAFCERERDRTRPAGHLAGNGKGSSVDGPAVESFFGCIILRKRHLDRLIWRW